MEMRRSTVLIIVFSVLCFTITGVVTTGVTKWFSGNDVGNDQQLENDESKTASWSLKRRLSTAWKILVFDSIEDHHLHHHLEDHHLHHHLLEDHHLYDELDHVNSIHSPRTSSSPSPPRTSSPRLLLETQKKEEDDIGSGMSPFTLWFIIVTLVVASGLFSGLTLGLLGLDLVGLDIVSYGEDKELAKYAKKIIPVRENGNQLLCTLLLGNVAVNSLLSILMAGITGGTFGLIVSTAVIVIFGEIIPQASCSRYALQIGARVVILVRIIMFLFYPIAKPLAYCLDKALGEEIGTIHSKKELMRLLAIHVREGALKQEEGDVVAGALKFRNKPLSKIMTHKSDSFLLSDSSILDYACMLEISNSGFSRIPVYGKDDNDIVGCLVTKDLIFVDPEDKLPLNQFLKIFGRHLELFWVDDTCGSALNRFKKGKAHLGLIREVNNTSEDRDPFIELKGIVTLEDVIEEIIQDKIVDETDVYIDIGNRELRSGLGSGALLNNGDNGQPDEKKILILDEISSSDFNNGQPDILCNTNVVVIDDTTNNTNNHRNDHMNDHTNDHTNDHINDHINDHTNEIMGSGSLLSDADEHYSSVDMMSEGINKNEKDSNLLTNYENSNGNSNSSSDSSSDSSNDNPRSARSVRRTGNGEYTGGILKHTSRNTINEEKGSTNLETANQYQDISIPTFSSTSRPTTDVLSNRTNMVKNSTNDIKEGIKRGKKKKKKPSDNSKPGVKFMHSDFTKLRFFNPQIRANALLPEEVDILCSHLLENFPGPRTMVSFYSKAFQKGDILLDRMRVIDNIKNNSNSNNSNSNSISLPSDGLQITNDSNRNLQNTNSNGDESVVGVLSESFLSNRWNLKKESSEKWDLSRRGMLWLLIEGATVETRKRKAPPRSAQPHKDDWIYRFGEKADFLTIVLTGVLMVKVGRDALLHECGAFSVLAIDSLADAEDGLPFIADFSAAIWSETVRVVKIRKREYDNARRLDRQNKIPMLEPVITSRLQRAAEGRQQTLQFGADRSDDRAHKMKRTLDHSPSFWEAASSPGRSRNVSPRGSSGRAVIQHGGLYSKGEHGCSVGALPPQGHIKHKEYMPGNPIRFLDPTKFISNMVKRSSASKFSERGASKEAPIK